MSDPEIVSAGDNLASLQRFHRWVACQDDRIPRQPGNGNFKAKVNDPRTWGSYDAAKATRGAPHLGFVLSDLEHIAVLDLDACRNPSTGQLKDWAQALLSRLPKTYIEISLSGSGLHVFGVISAEIASGTYVLPRGEAVKAAAAKQGQDQKAKLEKIEVYARAKRAVLITGNVLGEPYPFADISVVVNELLAEHASRHGPKSNGKSNPNEAITLDGLPADVVDLIVNGTPADTDRSERLYYVVAVLREHGRSRASIIATLRAHAAGIARKCLENGKDEIARHVDMILKDIDDKIAAQAAAAAGVGASRPLIRLDPDRVTEIAVAVEAAMLAAGLPIYEHGDGRIVHPIKVKTRGANNTWTVTAALADIGVPLMRSFMSQAARFERPGRKGWLATEPPERVAKLILGRRGLWDFPKIRGLVTVPTLRPDGSLLSKPGFDPATGYFLFDPPSLPPLPDKPTKDDAVAGLALLNDLLDEFPSSISKAAVWPCPVCLRQLCVRCSTSCPCMRSPQRHRAAASPTSPTSLASCCRDRIVPWQRSRAARRKMKNE
jgi:hypothetical protein